MQRFGENAQASSRDSEEDFQEDEDDGRPHRAERRQPFFARCEFDGFRVHSGDYTLGLAGCRFHSSVGLRTELTLGATGLFADMTPQGRNWYSLRVIGCCLR